MDITNESQDRFIISKEELIELYTNQCLNTYQIAEKFGCCQATIWKRLTKYSIKARSSHELNSNIPSKENLLLWYVDMKLSTWKIEKEYGYSRGTVHRKLKEYGIITRNASEAHILFPKKDFSNDFIEKAYLIGFRLGDLGVRKVYKNSKTICVASGSTIKEQIDLIIDLFEDYSKVWVKETKDGKINAQTNLNETFGFLLSKTFPEWVEGDKEYFFAFLAGFSDAEGCISISRGMDYYSLSNYDNNLLERIKQNLILFGVKCNKLCCDKRKGKITFLKYRFNQDYWTLKVSDKENLLKLLIHLKPYTKHANKIIVLNRAIENINMRNELYGKK